MKKFLYKGILFFLIFFLVEKSTYLIINRLPVLEYDKRLELLIKGEINKELIVLGSSRGVTNVLAHQIEDQTGLTTFNLSYMGSNILFHEFILQTLLKYNSTPEIIIFVLDNPYEFIDVKSLTFRYDRMYPLSKYNYINNELINQKERNLLSKVFGLARLTWTDFKLEKKAIPIDNPMDSTGSMPYIRKIPKINLEYNTTSIDYSSLNESTNKLEAFKDIQKICSKNNIELIFVFSPDYRKFNDSFKKRFEKLLKSENRLMVYDTLNPFYKNSEYYYDASHLLKNGATIFTSEITDFLKMSYNSEKIN
jgi:hypothetical protein